VQQTTQNISESRYYASAGKKNMQCQVATEELTTDLTGYKSNQKFGLRAAENSNQHLMEHRWFATLEYE
jgi:hypothetical protein